MNTPTNYPPPSPSVEEVIKASVSFLQDKAKMLEAQASDEYDEDMNYCTELRRRASILLNLTYELSEGKPLSGESKLALRNILFCHHDWISTDSFKETK